MKALGRGKRAAELGAPPRLVGSRGGRGLKDL